MGLTLEQLQKMGATPISRVGGESTGTPATGGGLTADQLRGMGATPGGAPVVKEPTTPGVLFPATGNEGNISAPLKTLGNIPGSAVGFAKGTFDFLNPLNTLKRSQDIGQSIYDAGQEGVTVGDVVKELPKATYETLVPKFFRSLFSGDTKGALKVLEEDPVGQLAPVILAGRGVAEKAGFGPQFDSIMSKTVKAGTKPLVATGSALGSITTGALGKVTGAGGESVKTAVITGANKFFGGQKEQADFRGAMTSNGGMSDVLQESQGALARLKSMRSQEYQSKLTDIKGNKSSLDISPVHEALQRNLVNFNVKPISGEIGPQSFDRSVLQNDPTAQTIFKKVYDNMKSYGTQPGDRTPIALDTLKRSLGDLYSDNSSVRSFVTDMESTVGGLLKKNVPGYEEMTKGYAETSNLIKDIKQNLAVGGKASEASAISRLTNALKQNNELRLEVLKDFEDKTGINLRDKIAGASLGEKLPRGLIGSGIDLYAFSHAISTVLGGGIPVASIAQMLLTSPRFVGELMNGLGVTAGGAWKILKPINEVPMLFFDRGSKAYVGRTPVLVPSQPVPKAKGVENTSQKDAKK